MRRRIVAAACAGVALTGCNASMKSETTKEAVPLEVTAGTATFTAEAGDKPDGRFYAVIGGETSNDNRLYELTFTPPALRLLTETNRVSSVGACRDKVVVAAGQQEVGFSDHLQELRAGALHPLEGSGVQPGFTPDLDDDCRVAYTWVDRTAGSQDFELRVSPAENGSVKTLYRGQPGDGPLVNPQWGPDGEVAVVRQPSGQATEPHDDSDDRPAAVIIVRPDGSTSEIATGGHILGVTWGRRWLAVMDEREGTIFIDAKGGQRTVLPGWYPLTWSPDGDQLLLHDASTQRTLGIVDAADLNTVRPAGMVSGPVWDVDWLPARN